MGGGGVWVNFFWKFNQIWRVSYLHECHMQRHHFLGPYPQGPRGGAKRSNIIKSELHSQFQRLLNQTLCIFLQMKDRNISDWIFLRPPGHAQGWGLGVPWGLGVKFFFRNSTRFGVRVTYMNGTCTGTMFWVPTPWALGMGQKFNFLNMVMWHIKFKGMSSRPGYTKKFNL